MTQPGQQARQSDQETDRAVDQTSASTAAGFSSSDHSNAERRCAFTVRIPEDLQEENLPREALQFTRYIPNKNKIGGANYVSRLYLRYGVLFQRKRRLQLDHQQHPVFQEKSHTCRQRHVVRLGRWTMHRHNPCSKRHIMSMDAAGFGRGRGRSKVKCCTTFM